VSTDQITKIKIFSQEVRVNGFTGARAAGPGPVLLKQGAPLWADASNSTLNIEEEGVCWDRLSDKPGIHHGLVEKRDGSRHDRPIVSHPKLAKVFLLGSQGGRSSDIDSHSKPALYIHHCHTIPTLALLAAVPPSPRLRSFPL
jgi:hypothetical protein